MRSSPGTSAGLQEAWRRFKKNKVALASLIFLGILLVISVGTLVIDLVTKETFYDAHVINQDLLAKLKAPSLAHPLGQDEFGRDVLFRILWGARYSLFLGITTVIVAAFFGTTSEPWPGSTRRPTTSSCAAWTCCSPFPPRCWPSASSARWGRASRTSCWPWPSLTSPPLPGSFASVLSIKEQEFIEASRSYGSGDGRIIFKYILPNALTPLIVQSTLSVASAILMIASLSFIGLGIQPPTPEWGAMLSNARIYMRDALHITLVPGVAIMLTILSLNLVGDGLRDALDPKLKD